MIDDVLSFWFEECEQAFWWQKDADFDQSIAERFGTLHKKAASGELFQWRKSPDGCLAEIIVLDQFSRNIYRDEPEAFACDPLALALAQNAVASGFDQQLSQIKRNFLYLPYMHSESKLVHEEAVKIYHASGDAYTLEFEMKHKAIIDRFGRYPHRNAILGRESTAAEIAFLQTPNSSF